MKLAPQVRRVRLLPVVVVAASALLTLKTIGLATNGGYVLIQPAKAAGDGSEALAEPQTLTTGPTVADTAPLVTDRAPTAGGPAAGHGSDGEDTDTATRVSVPETDLTQFDLAAQSVAAASAGMTPPAVGIECPSLEPTVVGDEGGSDSDAAPIAPPRLVGIDCTAEGDALPRIVDPTGAQVPLAAPGAPTEQALLARLAERRSQLDAYAEELDLRAALVEAAEQRIEERMTTMQSIEHQIASLVEQRQAAESELVAGVVTMYENMRPRDAAAIFDQLDMSVLVPIAKAMPPRKMAPIMAQMQPARAQELTVRLAAVAEASQPMVAQTGLEALPQIVGQ